MRHLNWGKFPYACWSLLLFAIILTSTPSEAANNLSEKKESLGVIADLEEDNVKIIDIRCGNSIWVYVDILITSHKSGILSYTLFPTWGGGGDISTSYSTPLPKRVEKTLMFRQPVRDSLSRKHQFGLKAKFGLHGSVEKYAGSENTFEPDGRCPGT